MKGFLLAFCRLGFGFLIAFAFDPSPLQDFCVATDNPKDIGVFVNGNFCKYPKLAKAEDFFFSVKNPGNTDNQVGSNVTAVNVEQISRLNTLAILISGLRFAMPHPFIYSGS